MVVTPRNEFAGMFRHYDQDELLYQVDHYRRLLDDIEETASKFIIEQKLEAAEAQLRKFSKPEIEAPGISRELIDSIKERVGILGLVEEYGGRPRRNGRNMVAICPFHAENSPSFTIYEDGRAYCFGCAWDGDVIKFVMEMDRLRFPEAVEKLANEAGIEIPKQTFSTKRRRASDKTATVDGNDPGESSDDGHQRFPRTDTGNAERLITRHGGKIRFNWGRNVWHYWDGKRWAPDTTGKLERLAKDTVRAIPAEAAGLNGPEYAAVLKWAATSESDGKRQAMIRLARSEPGIPVQPDQLDAHPWLLNVANGTIDLKTGKCKPHDPTDMITRLINVVYDPEATCPIFDAFLSKIFDGDKALVQYIWRLIGYSLTGSIREQIIILCWGTGSNGKSTLLSVIRDLLGDYASEADAESFMERKSEMIREDIAALDGARFVAASETSDGRRLSEALVKKMTGGERLRARRLYENGYEFLPQFKAWLASNYKPMICGGGHAIWRRVKFIPFTVTISDDEKDPELHEKLRAELPGILAKAVQACLEWQHDGLKQPKVITEATDAYRREMDILAEWLEDRCILKRGVEELTKQLYADYTTWCEAQGYEPIKQRTFGQRLTEHGCGERKSGSHRYRTGIKLRSHPDDDNDDGSAGTQGTQGTQEPETPYRENDIEKFRENASHTSHASHVNGNGRVREVF